jgi:hypothetical protein
MKKNGTSSKTQINFYHQSMRRINMYQYNAILLGFVWHHIPRQTIKNNAKLSSKIKRRHVLSQGEQPSVKLYA